MLRKLTCWRFVCTEIFSPRESKMRTRSFLALSASLLEVVFIAARPSSRYRPTFLPKRCSRECKMKRPTSSQISAPS